MHTHAIVVNGQVSQSWQLNSVLQILDKCRIQCRRMGYTLQWADHGYGIKRKTDPSWVVWRNNGRFRVYVVVNLTQAPADWLDQLHNLYGWGKP